MRHARDFFQTYGALDVDSPSYVERPADSELLEAIGRHELCLVLAPRQMGKSSLMVRARKALIDRGARVAIVDLQFESHVKSVEQLFSDVVNRIRGDMTPESVLPPRW